MDDPHRSKTKAFRDLGFTGPATTKQTTRVNQIGTRRPMNRTINPAATKQRRVRGIHHDIDLLLGDVSENYPNIHLWSIASMQHAIQEFLTIRDGGCFAVTFRF
jgi:hypothetical protein